ncbi:MAG: MFS transporter [Spirochaetia bacterium]|nr:MFS transporter [Spirochaetia bacterium]
MSGRKPRAREMLAFGVGDIYGGGAFFVIGALFLVFLTDVAGLPASLGGLILMVGKIWDAVTDPLMGFISDRTRSRFGRRRVYFLAGIIPVFLSFAALWLSPGGTRGARFAYYLVAYFVFNTVFTMVMIPYNALPAEMTDSYALRSRMTGVRMLFSQLGVLAGSLLARTVVAFFPTEAAGYRAMGLAFGLLFALPWILTFLGTYEREGAAPEKAARRGLGRAALAMSGEFLSTLRNRSLRVHIAMYLAAYVTIDVFNALFLFYLKDYLGKGGLYQVLLGAVVLTQMASLYLVSRGCARRGNAPTYRRHLALWAAGFALFTFIGPGTPLAFMLAAAVLVGAGMSGGAMVPFNNLAFVADADELISARRREGVYAGMMTFVRKTAQAVALFLVGLGLDALGYESGGAAQSRATAEGIRAMMVVAPAALLAFGFFASFRFRIDPAAHRVILDSVERLKAGAAPEELDPDARAVCEAVTGLPAARLWRAEPSRGTGSPFGP